MLLLLRGFVQPLRVISDVDEATEEAGVIRKKGGRDGWENDNDEVIGPLTRRVRMKICVHCERDDWGWGKRMAREAAEPEDVDDIMIVVIKSVRVGTALA